MTTTRRVKRPPKVLWVAFDSDGEICALETTRRDAAADYGDGSVRKYLLATAHAPTKARK